MYHLAFFVPEQYAEIVKEALFKAGAGKIGNYSHCSFESRGLGQFLALAGSLPLLGKEGQLEKVTELKVEMVCEKNSLSAAIEALKATHPYETPTYYATELLQI